MRKTVTITIGGSLFHIEEDAYSKLDAYLHSIREHFASYDDAAEIVSDIESRIAEEFVETLKDKKRAAVTEGDIGVLMSRMGTVKDFAAFDADGHVHGKEGHESPKENVKPKRLYRDTEGQMIAGVAKGIANYMGIEPWIVRAIFLGSLLFHGAGILIYIVLWIVLPEAKTPSERTEMRGSTLTLKHIEATVREKVPEAAKNVKPENFKRILLFPFEILRRVISFIGRILRIIIPFAGRILGFFMILGTLAALLFLTFWFIMLMTSSWEQYMDVPLRELAGNAVFYTTLIAGYIVAFIPVVMIFGAGISLLQLKNVFRLPTVMTLIGVWIVALLTGAVTVASATPSIEQKVDAYIDAHNIETTKNISLKEFKALEVYGDYDVHLHKGNAFALTITGPQMAVDALRTEIQDDQTLTISNESAKRFCILCLGNSATIDLTVPSELGNIGVQAGATIDIDGITLVGERLSASAGSRMTVTQTSLPTTLALEAHAGSSLIVESTRILKTLSIDTAAGSRVEYWGSADTTTANVHAGSRVILSGSGQMLTAEVVAGSQLEAAEFTVTNAKIDAAAGGYAEVRVTGELSGSAHGGGSIEHSGNPKMINIEEDPSGDVSEWEG